MGTPVVLQVVVDSDPLPGTFHTLQSIEETVARILRESIPHYDPRVTVDAPASLRLNLERQR
jgi:hypothetical protein